MPKYRYVIIDQQGRERSGTVQAPNSEAVRTALRAKLASVKNLWELTPSGHLTPCFEEPVEAGSGRLWTLATAVGGLLFALCVLVWAWPKSTSTTDTPLTQISFRATGTLQSELAGAELTDLKLYGVMPEIFLQREGRVDPDTGRFELSFDFETRHVPRALVLEVEKDRRRWEIDQKTLGGETAMELGTIFVKAPPVENRS